MNRIVRENFPVSQLPEDLRREFPGSTQVTLIVDARTAAEVGRSTDEAALADIRRTGIRGGDFSRFKHLRRAHFSSSERADDHISAMRDEWADRER
jgi:hypothetical protein